MLFLKNQSIQFLKALRIKQLQDFCFLKYIMGLKNIWCLLSYGPWAPWAGFARRSVFSPGP